MNRRKLGDGPRDRAILLALAGARRPAAGRRSAQTSGGNLAGQVQDKDGAPLPGVTVTATQQGHRPRPAAPSPRATATSCCRRCRSAPTPSRSSSTASPPVTIDDVKVNVASQRDLEVDHEPVDVQETITVVDEAPLVQTTPAIGAVVSQQQLENLPLNGRQFANLAVLAPGTCSGLQLRPDQAGPAHRRAQRRHRPQRQLPDRRRRQHRRHDRRRAAELQPGERPGVQHPDAAVQGRVRPLDRRRADRRHQDRHQRLRTAAPRASSARTA